MAAKANARRFRIGVEGATTDGRTIERAWLEQMAANYDPAVYTALINMEHIKGYTPDSPFRRYGKVEALETEEIQDGLLSGKLALYAYLAPTDDLIALTKKWQKTFTSMEVNPDFADTGSAYLVGLAVTDDPASLGTEMLTFSAGARQNPLAARKQSPDNLFTAAEETPLVFEPDDNKPSLFSRISALFAKKQTSDDARFNDVHQAVELVAQEQQQLAGQVQQHSAQLARLASLETDMQAHKTELASLKETLSQQDRNSAFRPLSTGGADTATVLTDC
ncbi:GPO family capsid scaffolding protein [Dickeya oryzae]|uniref:GPO family capsid scaffolding protein n=1 Tax=Dickeya oryzae TaxID=1240404 RepID=UPI001AECEDC4|nr:GPO family capsid scaffolding protein [Dickeya oryzae]MBP2850537.1 GPO family capsid scaffolding protein [Dickeya oryzae]